MQGKMQGKMNVSVVSCAAMLAVGSMLVGCNTAKKSEVALLKEENSQLTMKLEETNTALEGAQQDRRRLEEENAKLKAAANEKPVAVVAEATPAAKPEPVVDMGPDVTVEHRDGALVLTIASDVLFDSGKAALKPNAKKTLDRVVSEIKKKYPTKPLRFAGFTDQDPIKSSDFKTNYHLGFERAFNVGQYVVTHGIDKSLIEYASYGPEQLKSSKKQSRRVEIAIVNADN